MLAACKESPFAGSNVNLSLYYTFWGDEEVDSDDDDNDADNGFVNKSIGFIQNFGYHITKLNILPLDASDLSNQDMARLLVCAVLHCKRLSTLSISSEEVDDLKYVKLTYTQVRSMFPLDFQVASTLIDLNIDIPDVLLVQNRILQECHGQLEKLTLQSWRHKAYADFQWTNLKHLCIEKPPLCSDPWSVEKLCQFLVSLGKASMPNLTELTLFINCGQGYFKQLLEMTWNFPRLTTLNLDFAVKEGFHGLPKAELAALPKGLGLAHSIKNLSLRYLHAKCYQDFTFLLWCPSVERMDLKAHNFMNYCKTGGSLPTELSSLVEISFYLVKKESLYKSNVWEVLPFLKVLVVAWRWDTGINCDKVFHRFDYKMYCKEKQWLKVFE